MTIGCNCPPCRWARVWKRAAKEYSFARRTWKARAERAEHMLALVTKERDWAWHALESDGYNVEGMKRGP